MRKLLSAICLCAIVLTNITAGTLSPASVQSVSGDNLLDFFTSALSKRFWGLEDLWRDRDRDPSPVCPSCGKVKGEIEVREREREEKDSPGHWSEGENSRG